MNVVKNLCLSFCAAAVVGSCLRLLCPSGSMEKVFRASISVFFLCCIVASIFSTQNPYQAVLEEWSQRITKEESIDTEEDLAAAFRNQVLEQFRYSITLHARQALEQEKLYPKKVLITVHDGEGGRIEMEQVILLMDLEYQKQDGKIKQVIYKELGIWPEVNYGG